MSSFWIDTTKNFYKPYPVLEKDVSCDVCIIGGGLAGLTCSYLLSKRGLSTITIERSSICEHTSRKYYSEKLQALMDYFTIIFLIHIIMNLLKNI